MRVANVDGLVTLYYDGSKELYNEELDNELYQAHRRFRGENATYLQNHEYFLARRWFEEDVLDIETLDLSVECKSYLRERLSWQQIIVVDGVTEIPRLAFLNCYEIKRVIFANNTDVRIEEFAFYRCKNLVFIKLSLSVRYIGDSAFLGCNLSSVFIPPRCRKIWHYAFSTNKNLSILNVPPRAQLGAYIIAKTALAQASPYDTTEYDRQDSRTRNGNINQWLKKHMNNGNQFALHRACASFNPLKEVIQAIVQEKGLKAFTEKNSAGITPLRYLKENPYTELSEKEIIHDHVMKMIGEIE